MKNLYVNPIASIAIMISTVVVVLTTGAIAVVFSSSYESNCTNTGCTTNLKFGGWGAVPLEGIAAAAGTSFGVYTALKNGKRPERKEEASSDLPS